MLEMPLDEMDDAIAWGLLVYLSYFLKKLLKKRLHLNVGIAP